MEQADRTPVLRQWLRDREKAAHAYTIAVPVKTQNESNGPRGQWFGTAKRRKEQRLAVWAAMNVDRLRLMELKSWPRWSITLTRLAPSSGLDDDGLRTALKSVRDGVVKELGIGRTVKITKGKKAGTERFVEDDRDARLTFHYEQRRDLAYSVLVRFELPEAT